MVTQWSYKAQIYPLFRLHISGACAVERCAKETKTSIDRSDTDSDQGVVDQIPVNPYPQLSGKQAGEEDQEPKTCGAKAAWHSQTADTGDKNSGREERASSTLDPA